MPEREGQLRGPNRRMLQLFDRVEVIFLPMFQARQRLRGQTERLTTERFRWDAAAEEFSWTGSGLINRSVHVYLATSGEEGEGDIPATVPLQGRYSNLVVEVNAWQDDENLGKEGTRRSRHAVVDRIKPPSLRTARMYESFKRAYLAVSEWTEVDLTTVTPLHPRPLPSAVYGFPGPGSNK